MLIKNSVRLEMLCTYTVLHIFRQVLFRTKNQGNHQNFDPSLLANFHWVEAKFFSFFEKKNSKWPTQKTLIFQLRQFSIFFHENFMDWSLGKYN